MPNANKIVFSKAPLDIEGLGDISVGLTEVLIDTTKSTKIFRIFADEDNSGIIFIGLTGVLADKTNCFAYLEAGDEITFEYNDNTNNIYVISDVAGQLINVGIIKNNCNKNYSI